MKIEYAKITIPPEQTWNATITRCGDLSYCHKNCWTIKLPPLQTFTCSGCDATYYTQCDDGYDLCPVCFKKFMRKSGLQKY